MIQLNRWHSDGLMDSLAQNLLTFVNGYTSNAGRLPDLLVEHQCKSIFQLCFFVLKDRYYEYLYELNMKQTIEVTVSVLFHLIDSEFCNVGTMAYPFDRLIEVLHHKHFSRKCKT